MKKLLFIILSVAFLAGCDKKIDEYPASSNGVDFSNYVAIGNSLTSGYCDNALYLSGQQNSYPNILATQFQTVGGGAFRQPLIGTEDGVGFTPIPGGLYYYTKLALKIVPDKDCQGNPTGTASLKPAVVVDNPDQNTLKQQLFSPPTVAGPYNNMGVTGATVQSIFYNRLGDPTPDGHPFNPYYVRFASSVNASILQDAMTQQPTFFSMWIGNYDILQSAVAGTDQLLTPADTFAKYYPLAVGAMVNSGKKPKGVLANVPDITSIPYFTTISASLPYNSVVLDSAQAAGLNILYTMYGHPDIHWQVGQNPFVYVKSDGSWAQMKQGDLLLLTIPTDSIKCKGMGVADPTAVPLPKPYPIAGKYILDMDEQVVIQTRIAAYNAVIASVAGTLNLALADMNAYLKLFKTGMVFDGVKFNTNFITGGLFSTDGVHLNPRGNALTANYFIQSINAKYGCSIPQADITKFKGVIFP